MWILKPEYFSFEGLLIHSFPVSNAPYWYLSAYVGLFVLIPFLNAGIHSLSNEQAKKYQALLFFVFSIIPTIARKDTFFVNVGYSTIWLSYLYGIGACIKKFGWGDSLKPCKAIWIYVCCVVISWGMKVGCESVTNYLLGTPKTGFILIAYTSPTIIIAAIALLIAFKNMRIPTRFNGFISAFAPAAFGLLYEYLVPLVREVVFPAPKSPYIQITSPALSSFANSDAIFIVSSYELLTNRFSKVFSFRIRKDRILCLFHLHLFFQQPEL